MIMSKYDKLIGKWMDRHYCRDVEEDGKYIHCDKKTFTYMDANNVYVEFEDEYWEIVYMKRSKVLEYKGSILDQIIRTLKPSDMKPQDFYNITRDAIQKWFSEKFSVIVVYDSVWD
jgi:hypothetical protein